jgi:hypothetical protein
MKALRQNRTFKGSGPGAVMVSFFALLLILMIPPLFMMPIGTVYYAGRPGSLFAVLAAVISTWAFMECPRRLIPKLMTFVLLVPTLYYAVNYVCTYLAYGPRS